jgi:hypothetical protein
MIYTYKGAQKVAQKRIADGTVLNDVITRVDIWIGREDTEEKIPHSLMLEEPTVEAFIELANINADQLVSWVTEDFTTEFEQHMSNLIDNRINAVDSTVSKVEFD